jgi:hypothetical protein
MRSNNSKKEFDCVELMREVKAKVSKETKGLNYLDLKKFISFKLKKRKLKLAD